MKRYKDKIKAAKNLRFYEYSDFRDKFFIVLANPLAYLFYNLGLQANTVTLISGLISILGGIFLTSTNRWLVFGGSLCIPIFYLLDYVDGIIARLNKKNSVGGNYIDLIMHQVVAISISLGIFVGALKSVGEFIIPFGFFSVIASSFLLSRFSIGWFSIIFKFFEQKSKHKLKPIFLKDKIKKKNILISIILRLGALLFHEDYAIFSLPIIFFLNIFLHKYLFFDVRAFITIYGAVILFPSILLDIIYFSNNKLDSNFNNLIDKEIEPDLPDILYFKK